MYRFLRLFPCCSRETDHDDTTIETIIHRSTANPTGWFASTKSRASVSNASAIKTATPGAAANLSNAATNAKCRATTNIAGGAQTKISLPPLATRVDTDGAGHSITDHKLHSTGYAGKFAQ